jgi:hydroxymethylcytosylglucuronate/cytosylglucuronate synthase
MPRFLLLAAARYIGWGGFGKLRLILEHLPQAKVAFYGHPFLADLPHGWLDPLTLSGHSPGQSDVAVVINDVATANRIADLGVPVVFVESLPYLRNTDADIPRLDRLAHYCAQKYPIDRLPLANPSLRNLQTVKWIDPIVPPAPERRGGQGVIVNVGGLYSFGIGGLTQLANRSASAYLELALFPLVRILREQRRTILAVCGNLSAENCERLRDLAPGCRAVGPQTPAALAQMLADADLLITSPGSTTILQAAAMGLPTLLLPPQNPSQIYNLRIYTRPDANAMQWPVSVVDASKVEELSFRGLVDPLNHLYHSIIEAAKSARAASDVTAALIRMLQDASADGVLNRDLASLGFAGASQVARLIEKTALARQVKALATQDN